MKSKQILFIGNSFTNRNDLPGVLARLAAAAKPPIRLETDRVIANGMALKTHWERGPAREAIRSSKWDYVVLQEQSTLPLKNATRMHEYVRLFDQDIRAGGAETVLYMTWARRHQWERQAELAEAYTSIGESIGAIVVPVGQAWQRLMTERPDLILHDKDNSHPNFAGSYLAACVFFASLFKGSPEGLQTSDLPKLEPFGPGAASALQQAAWLTVRDHQ
jgi:hypothetical protein